MKRLTLIIIGVLLCTPLYSDMNTYIYGVASAPACSSCNSSTDTRIIDPELTATTETNSFLVASQFTLAESACVTGVWMNCGAARSSGNALYGEIWSSSENNPGALVTGCTGNISLNSILTLGDNEFLFSETIELPAGTYFIVGRTTGSSQWEKGYQAGAGGTERWSTDGVTWSSSTKTKDMGILGCE